MCGAVLMIMKIRGFLLHISNFTKMVTMSDLNANVVDSGQVSEYKAFWPSTLANMHQLQKVWTIKKGVAQEERAITLNAKVFFSFSLAWWRKWRIHAYNLKFILPCCLLSKLVRKDFCLHRKIHLRVFCNWYWRGLQNRILFWYCCNWVWKGLKAN